MADISTKQTMMTSTTTTPPRPPILQWPLISGDTGSEQLDHDVTYPGHQREDYLLVGLLHTIGLVLALVGNCSVIVIIARTKKLHTPSSLLVLVLATSDLLLSLFWNLVPLLLTFDDGVNRMLLQSRIACNVIGFAWQTMLTISTLSHSIVALDRYLFIVHPMKYQVYVTVKATSILTCVIIVIASLLSALTFITKSEFRFLPIAGMCIGSPIWSLFYLFLVFIPSLTVALFAYQRIWRLCVSIFKQEDIDASRGHSPRVSISNHLPSLSLSSSRNHSRSDLSVIADLGDFKTSDDYKTKRQRRNSVVDKESKTATQKRIVTTVTTQHTTRVTRKNTTKTTTIASGPCESSIPVEDPRSLQDESFRKRKIDRKISEVTEVEVEETTSTSLERKRTHSVTIHTHPPSLESSADQTQIKPDDTHCATTTNTISSTTEVSAEAQSRPNETLEPVLIPEPGDVKSSEEDNHTTVSKNKRPYSKYSIIPFLSRKQQKSQNPFIVTTSAESLTSISNMDLNISTNQHPSSIIKNSAHLTITDPFPSLIATPPHQTSYETITKKLFGSQAILPSLLYVGILMPLSMQPVTSSYKHRRLRVCLLIGLPVLIMTVSFLPFPGSLIYLGYLHSEDLVGNGVGMFLIKLICHLTYALVPSLTSLLLCLNNKPYRRALRQTIRCRCF